MKNKRMKKIENIDTSENENISTDTIAEMEKRNKTL